MKRLVSVFQIIIILISLLEFAGLLYLKHNRDYWKNEADVMSKHYGDCEAKKKAIEEESSEQDCGWYEDYYYDSVSDYKGEYEVYE